LLDIQYTIDAFTIFTRMCSPSLVVAIVIILRQYLLASYSSTEHISLNKYITVCHCVK